MNFHYPPCPGIVSGIPFVPSDLGAKYLADWDAARSDLITIATGISSWLDVVGGYDLAQATGANQPTYSATSFNGRAGATFDGTNDELTGSIPVSFPVGSDGSEIHMCVNQPLAAGTAGSPRIFCYGGASSATSRSILRVVGGGTVNRAACLADGSNTINNNVDFSNRHYICGAFTDASNRNMYIDAATVATTGSLTLNTSTPVRVRMGASTANTPANYFNGTVHRVIVTLPLTSGERSSLTSYMMALL